MPFIALDKAVGLSERGVASPVPERTPHEKTKPALELRREG
jgi:hypothetical protein